MLLLQDFDYELPPERIAQYPANPRSSSRLFCLNKSSGECQHKNFTDILEFLRPNDLLVFNDTKVIPARLFGKKPTGGQVEILIERVLGPHKALAHVKASKSPKPETTISLENGAVLKVLGRNEDLFELAIAENASQSFLELLHEIGRIPLPPYLNRTDEVLDHETYQTIYAKNLGAVAAPTAGLHFDASIMKQLEEKNIQKAFVTLHVGAGTFQPVRIENIAEHKMHSEIISINQETCDKINLAKQNGHRVIAVGTTTIRVLETAFQPGGIHPFAGETKIFIYPGYKFKCVDAMITNFHLPQSTLLMLVCAFAGREKTLNAYQEAVQHKYRFFSYGDAMWVE